MDGFSEDSSTAFGRSCLAISAARSTTSGFTLLVFFMMSSTSVTTIFSAAVFVASKSFATVSSLIPSPAESELSVSFFCFVSSFGTDPLSSSSSSFLLSANSRASFSTCANASIKSLPSSSLRPEFSIAFITAFKTFSDCVSFASFKPANVLLITSAVICVVFKTF